jgi:hypothetical protein
VEAWSALETSLLGYGKRGKMLHRIRNRGAQMGSGQMLECAEDWDEVLGWTVKFRTLGERILSVQWQRRAKVLITEEKRKIWSEGSLTMAIGWDGQVGYQVKVYSWESEWH